MAELVQIITLTPGDVRIPNVTVHVYDEAGVYVTSGISNGDGEVEFTLDAGAYELRAHRAGYEVPDPVEIDVSESTVSLSSAYPIPIERGDPVILVGLGFDETPADNSVTFTTETDPVIKTGETVSASRDVLVVHAPSNVEFGDVVSTSIYVTKPDPNDPGETVQSNTIVATVEAET